MGLNRDDICKKGQTPMMGSALKYIKNCYDKQVIDCAKKKKYGK